MVRDHELGAGTTTPPIDGSVDTTIAKSSVAPTAFGAARPPTYTTVGSIYNPHATTPLQPPTRRPRTHRYPPAAKHSPGEPLLGFPNALLSVLPIKDTVHGSPPPATNATTAAKLGTQYSPLQQNTARAISPITDQEKTALDISMGTPSMRAGNLPPPGFGLGTSDRQGRATTEEGDSIVPDDTLATCRITVKSLTNLASYPNPAQKQAREMLAKARTANPGSLPANPGSLPATAPLPPRGASAPGKDRVRSAGSSAIGTPLPLTAGPPGQRQFRPSTFEGAARAIAMGFDMDNTLAQPVAGPDERRPGIPQSTPYGAGVNQFLDREYCRSPEVSDPLMGDYEESFTTSDCEPVSTAPPGRGLPDAQSHMTAGHSPTLTKIEERRIPYDTCTKEQVAKFFPHRFPDDFGLNSASSMTERYPYTRRSSQDRERLADERRATVDARFYAQARAWEKNVEQVAREHDSRPPKNRVGVIGDGRERFRTALAGKTNDNDKVQLTHLSVQQANELHDSAHVEPLLGMGFATMLRRKEELSESNGAVSKGLPSLYAPADPAWIDSSPEGNKSFFETPKAEEPKRKKVIKRARAGRGY